LRETVRDLAAPFAPAIEAQAREIMRRPYRKMISGDDDEGYLIEVSELPGCMTAGETIAEAVAMLDEAMLLWIGAALEEGKEIPGPAAGREYNGRLLVRMPKTLHRRLIERAEDEGVSANQLAVALLAKYL
jgi:predicted RNase H-like HicB family nuclease